MLWLYCEKERLFFYVSGVHGLNHKPAIKIFDIFNVWLQGFLINLSHGKI